jgi:ribosome-associated protein
MTQMKFKNIRSESDLLITHTKGSGPGGQNRNKRQSGVRVVHLPTGISVLATERRSQKQNLDAAIERLDEKLERFFFRPKNRIGSAPSRSSQMKRVKKKKVRGETKQLRKKPRDSDW